MWYFRYNIKNLDIWGDKMSIVMTNVRRIICERGLKQCAVANKAGYTYQQFNNLMNDRKVVTDEDVVRLTSALDVTPNELFGLNGIITV